MIYITASGLRSAETLAKAQANGQAIRFVRTLCVPGQSRTYQFKIEGN